MKIIEALKQIKDLRVKAEDLRVKVSNHSAYLSIETPVYKDQTEQVRQWVQAHTDVVKEIRVLRHRLNKTNLVTPVTLTIGGVTVTLTIDEWIMRRRDLAKMDFDMWSSLTDRNLREGNYQPSTPGAPLTNITIVRCYDPVVRDTMREVYRSEAAVINSALEIVNATTDLVP